MIDAHNHLQDPRFAGRQAELIETIKSVAITTCVVNGTSEEDWPAVAQLTAISIRLEFRNRPSLD